MLNLAEARGGARSEGAKRPSEAQRNPKKEKEEERRKKMAHAFEGDKSTFKTMATSGYQGGMKINLTGVNPDTTDADMVLDGVSSLLAIASITPDPTNSSRTVTEVVVVSD